MPRIFISYSHQDKNTAKNVVAKLRAAESDNQVWFDENLKAGQIWSDKLVEEIIKSDVVLFLISPDSVKSDYCKQEIAQAQGARKPIIPLMIKTTPVGDFPLGVDRFQYQDVSAGVSSVGIERLQRNIDNIVQEAKAASAPPPSTSTVSVTQGDYIHNTGSGTGKIESQTNNYFQTPRFILFLLFILVIIIAVFVFLNRPQASPPEPKVAYEFLVDTSASMQTPLNGVPRFQIITDAIKQIANTPGLDTSRVYRSLRLAGGGSECKQTELAAQGRGDQLSFDQFIAPLDTTIPGGTSAVEAGIRASFKDLDVDAVRESDVKVVFILLGSLDFSECRAFDIPTALSAYKQLGISTVFCAFTLSNDLPGFERFQRQMLDNGFECVHNVETPEEISKIAVSIIENLIVRFKGEEIDLTPIDTPTEVVYLRPSDTPTPIFTDTPSKTPTPTATATASNTPEPTDTNEPTVTLTPSPKPPTNTASPEPTDTDEPTNTPTQKSTDTPRPTDTPVDTPTNTPNYATTQITRWTATAEARQDATATANTRATLTATYRPTATPTASSTRTPRPTATRTPTPTRTPTHLPTITPRPTQTPTPRPTSTPRPTIAPTHRPTSTPQPATVTVSVSNANLRSGPGTNYSTVGSASNGQQFDVIARTGTSGNRWYLVDMGNGSRGWISEQVATLDVAVSQVPVAATIPATAAVSGNQTGAQATSSSSTSSSTSGVTISGRQISVGGATVEYNPQFIGEFSSANSIQSGVTIPRSENYWFFVDFYNVGTTGFVEACADGSYWTSLTINGSAVQTNVVSPLESGIGPGEWMRVTMGTSSSETGSGRINSMHLCLRVDGVEYNDIIITLGANVTFQG